MNEIKSDQLNEINARENGNNFCDDLIQIYSIKKELMRMIKRRIKRNFDSSIQFIKKKERKRIDISVCLK